MDQAEWLAAYRRAVGDNDAARDYIDDLLIERKQLLAQVRELETRLRSLEAERNYWQRCAVNND